MIEKCYVVELDDGCILIIRRVLSFSSTEYAEIESYMINYSSLRALDGWNRNAGGMRMSVRYVLLVVRLSLKMYGG